MTWYHVHDCDCPIGCCDCGSKDEKPKPPKSFEHLDMATYELAKAGICPGCFSTDDNCECGEL